MPALAAATFVVFAEPLVSWSQQAWPPMTFLLLFTVTTYAAFRGFVRDEPRWQRIAAVAFLVTLLSYELALILPLGLGLYLAGRLLRRDPGWWKRSSTVDALAIGAVALVILAVLGLALRIGSLAAPAPSSATTSRRTRPRPASATTSGRSGGSHCRCCCWCRSGWAGASCFYRRPAGLGFLLAMLTAAFIVPTYVIQGKQEEQYGLAVVPLLGVLGAWGIGALASGRSVGQRSLLVATILSLACFGLVLRNDLET